jgi:hypothetical protein
MNEKVELFDLGTATEETKGGTPVLTHDTGSGWTTTG